MQRETSKFIRPDLWPQNSPNRNPVDCQIWGVVQDRLYQTPIQDRFPSRILKKLIRLYQKYG